MSLLLLLLRLFLCVLSSHVLLSILLSSEFSHISIFVLLCSCTLAQLRCKQPRSLFGLSIASYRSDYTFPPILSSTLDCIVQQRNPFSSCSGPVVRFYASTRSRQHGFANDSDTIPLSSWETNQNNMGRLIPLRLGSLGSFPDKKATMMDISSTTTIAAPPIPPKSPSRQRRPGPVTDLTIFPYTQEEWINVMAEIKTLYMKRQYKQSSTRCMQILDSIKDPVRTCTLTSTSTRILTNPVSRSSPVLDIPPLLCCLLTRTYCTFPTHKFQQQASALPTISVPLQKRRIMHGIRDLLS